MRAVHFGAGNIGRGFIGEILFKNDFEIFFVDINQEILDNLNERHAYTIGFAAPEQEQLTVSNVSGLHSQQNEEEIAQHICDSSIITTAIGPNVLPYIAPVIAKGLKARFDQGIKENMDVVACENMIGGTTFLREKVMEHVEDEDVRTYIEEHVGFPDAAVDRIVPQQDHADPLFVTVEPFSEWVIDESAMKATEVRLEGVKYVSDLTPYIERKLFTVNTGHATVAYTGAYYGYEEIGEAIADERVLNQLTAVLSETGALLESKWDFDADTHATYVKTIIERFQNPYISDSITRVARTPIRKLGYDERFIRPIREANERGLDHHSLVETVAMIYDYEDPSDSESVKLQELLKAKPLEEVVRETTNLQSEELILEIVQAKEHLPKK